MELRGIAFWSYVAGSLGLASCSGLSLLGEFGVLDLTGAWRVIWFAACVVMLAGLGLGYGLGHRAAKR